MHFIGRFIFQETNLNSFSRVPYIAAKSNVHGECHDIASLVRVLTEEEAKMDRSGDYATFSREYHELSGQKKIPKEGGTAVNIRTKRMIAFDFEKKEYGFSILICTCPHCIKGEFNKCQVYRDHYRYSKYQPSRSQQAKSALDKMSNTMCEFVKPLPKAPTVQHASFEYCSDPENRYDQSLDSNYESTETEEDIDDSTIEILVECPLEPPICYEVPVLPKFNDYMPGKNKSYDMTDVVWEYCKQMRDAYRKPNIGILSSTDLDILHQNTKMFKCSSRRLLSEISQLEEISKLKDVSGPVYLILILYGDPNMKRKHTMFAGASQTHDTPENIERSKRAIPGHFVTCHVNTSSGLVSVFDSLNRNPDEYSSRYFCDTAMHRMISFLVDTVNHIRAADAVTIKIERMPLFRVQTGSTCGPTALMVSSVLDLYVKFSFIKTLLSTPKR